MTIAETISSIDVLKTLVIWHHHDDVMKWNHFPRYWPVVRGIHRSLVNFPHKGLWRDALMCFLSAPEQTLEYKQSRRR